MAQIKLSRILADYHERNLSAYEKGRILEDNLKDLGYFLYDKGFVRLYEEAADREDRLKFTVEVNVLHPKDELDVIREKLLHSFSHVQVGLIIKIMEDAMNEKARYSYSDHYTQTKKQVLVEVD